MVSVEAGRIARFAAWCGPLIFVTLLGAIVYRLPTGIDLSDECYYAGFIDDWLKGGIATSKLATLHQTAALIVYPLAKIYFAIAGVDGLILFLRACYLLGSVLAAVAWFAFLLRIDTAFLAWLGACIVLAFIPFGLPAASYNTLGQQGLFVALAALGSARLGSPPTTLWSCKWLVISAIGWAVATVAYPMMIIPLGAGVLFLLIADREWDARWRYVAYVVAAQAIAWSVVIAVLSWHLYESVIYLSAIRNADNVARKVQRSLGRLKACPLYTVSLIVAAGVGVVRSRIPPVALSLVTAGLVASLFLGPASLFCRSHDVITVLGVMGIGLVWNRRASPRDRSLALVWSMSAIAGVVTAATSSNGLENFCIGGAPAAAAAVAALASSPRWARLAKGLACAVVLVALADTSLTYVYTYGRGTPSTKLQRIDSGAFAGTWGLPGQAGLVQAMRDRVAPMVGPENTIAVFGLWNGLGLATPARPLTPAILPMNDRMNPKGARMTKAFYENPANRPSLVVIFRSPWLRNPFNPMKENFPDWYERITVVRPGLGELELYRRR